MTERLWRGALAYMRWADRFAEVTGALSKWVVIPTVAVGFINVVLRYVGQLTSTRITNNAWFEAQWYLYSLIFLFGFAYILRHQINVRVDFWFAHQPLKRKAWIDLAGHLISLVPFAIMGILVSVPQVITSWELNEQSPDPSGLPRAPIKTMIPIAFALLLIQAIAEVIRVFAVLRDRVEFAELEEVDAPVRIE